MGAFRGFHYSAVTKTLSFAPKLANDDFCAFFPAETGLGVISLAPDALTIIMTEDELAVDAVRLTVGAESSLLIWGALAMVGEPARLAQGKRGDSGEGQQ